MKSKFDQVNTYKKWWHTIDFRDGVIAKGAKNTLEEQGFNIENVFTNIYGQLICYSHLE